MLVLGIHRILLRKEYIVYYCVTTADTNANVLHELKASCYSNKEFDSEVIGNEC